ncbi:hypothetical protein ACFLQ8_00615 [Candidatus Auribacterota bacterium]
MLLPCTNATADANSYLAPSSAFENAFEKHEQRIRELSRIIDLYYQDRNLSSDEEKKLTLKMKSIEGTLFRETGINLRSNLINRYLLTNVAHCNVIIPYTSGNEVKVYRARNLLNGPVMEEKSFTIPPDEILTLEKIQKKTGWNCDRGKIHIENQILGLADPELMHRIHRNLYGMAFEQRITDNFYKKMVMRDIEILDLIKERLLPSGIDVETMLALSGNRKAMSLLINLYNENFPVNNEIAKQLQVKDWKKTFSRILELYSRDKMLPETAVLLAKKELYFPHRGLHKRILEILNFDKMKAYKIHKQIRDEILHSNDALQKAVTLLMGNTWREKLLKGDEDASLEFSIEVFAPKMSGKITAERAKKLTKEIMLKEPRHTVRHACEIAKAMVTTRRPYEEVWRYVYMGMLGVPHSIAGYYTKHLDDDILLETGLHPNLKVILKYYSPEQAGNLFKDKSRIGIRTNATELFIEQGVSPDYAYNLLITEGRIPYTYEELYVLSKISTSVQKARTDRHPFAVFFFESRMKLLETLAVLTDLSIEHPSAKNPNLMDFDDTMDNEGMIAGLIPHWVPPGDGKSEAWPIAVILRNSGPDGIDARLELKEPNGSAVINKVIEHILSQEPRHTREMAILVAKRMIEEETSYGKVWKNVYLEELGLSREEADRVKAIKNDLVLDPDMQPTLKTICGYYADLPEMIKAFTIDPDMVIKTTMLNTLVRRGIHPYTAGSLLIGTQPHKLSRPQLKLLGDITLAVQNAIEQGLDNITLGFESTDNLRTAEKHILKIISKLKKGNLSYDEKFKVLIPRWMRSEQGRVYQKQFRVNFKHKEAPSLEPSVALSTADDENIGDKLTRAEYQKELTAKNGKRASLIKEEKTFFFFDEYGTPLAFHEGNINRHFNRLLEYLLREHGTVWTEGILITDHGNLPDTIPHITSRSRFKGSRKLKGYTAVRFTKGTEGKTVDTHYLPVEQFETVLSSENNQDPLLEQMLEKPKTKGLFSQLLAYVISDGTKKPFTSLPPEKFLKRTFLWELMKKANGQPVLLDCYDTTNNGTFRFLFAKEKGQRVGLEPKRMVDLILSPKNDGIELRFTYRKERRYSSPRTYVFNIYLPSSVTSTHPYFKDQDEMLLEDDSSLNGGALYKATEMETAMAVNDMIDTGIFTQEEWGQGQNIMWQERYRKIFEYFNGKLAEAITDGRISNPITVFYDSNGEVFDFVEHGYIHPLFKEKLYKALKEKEMFWIVGPKLSTHLSYPGFPDNGTLSLKGRGLQPGTPMAIRIEHGPENIALVTGVTPFAQAEQDLPNGDATSTIDCACAYLITNGGDRILIDASPAKVRKDLLEKRLKGLEGKYLILENVYGYFGKHATKYISGMPGVRLPKEIAGKRLHLTVSLDDLSVIECRAMTDEELDLARSGPKITEPESIHTDDQVNTSL